MKRKKVAAFVMATDMCMEENAAEACMEVSEQTENSEGVTENDGKVASNGLADNAGENQWDSRQREAVRDSLKVMEINMARSSCFGKF